MPRNLVICCDGTNNEFGPDKTNVARVVKVLERDSDQLVYYDPGVGTLPEPTTISKAKQNIRKLISLGFGWGLDKNVEEAYSFLMNYWEPADQVYLFGFSRGSYTVRVLAGLLHVLGLLPKGNEQLVPYLMRLYGGIRDRKYGGDEAEGSSKYWRLVNEFRGTFARQLDDQHGRRFPIHFVGVWDTVSSVGWVWEPKSYPFTFGNPSIRTVRHAVSIDERRWFFRQNLFKAGVKGQDLTELWFPGAHADIGGGYADKEGGVWRVAFEWMLSEAKDKGLAVNEERLTDLLNKAPTERPWAERIHESLIGRWWIAEIVPKWVYSTKTKQRSPGLGLGRSREILNGSKIQQAALLRIREKQMNYRPPNMTQAFVDQVLALQVVPEFMPYASI